MPSGQGKPDPVNLPTRYLEFKRLNTRGWVTLTIVDGEDRESIHVGVGQVREAAAFAEQLARTGELLLVSDYPGH